MNNLTCKVNRHFALELLMYQGHSRHFPDKALKYEEPQSPRRLVLGPLAGPAASQGNDWQRTPKPCWLVSIQSIAGFGHEFGFDRGVLACKLRLTSFLQ